MITGFKTQLKGVLTNAVSYFQDSGDPNAACMKAANEAGFNADQADRLVETFNTARVICHYKAAADKTSSCSLADKETVRRGLTVQPETKAAASFADYDFYKQAEVDHVVPEVKVAAAELKEEPISKEAASWLEERENLKVRELMKTAEEEARLARSTADMIAEKVAHAISRNVSLDDVHDKVARLVTAYTGDDRYYPGVEKVGEFIPAASDPDLALLKKYAKMHVVPTDDLAPFLPAIKEAADFVAEAAALDAYRAEMEKIAQQAAQTIESLPDDKDSLDKLLLKTRILSEGQKLQQGAAPAKPSGGGGGGGSKSPALSASGTVSFVTNLKDLLKGTIDQKAQARINKATDGVNNVRRQLILQDLLVNDKILSQEDPNAVAAAFRSVHQVSPDTTLNKEMLRSMLRSAVQSVAISPYDAKTLVDVDKARRQAYDPKAPKGGDNA